MSGRLVVAWKILFVAAALWSLLAGAWLAATPGTVVQESAISAARPQGEAGAERDVTVEQVSFYEMQGPWGIAILGIFAALYGGAGVMAWREWMAPALVSAALAMVLTVLAGFSVGPAYAPGLFALILGLILLGISRLLNGETA